MDVVVNATDEADTDEAVRVLMAPILDREARPDFLALHSSASHDLERLRERFAQAGVARLHGATTCRGVMAGGHMIETGGKGIGLFALWDPQGSFGTALAPVAGEPFTAGRMATLRALEDAGRAGEAADLVWISATPGQEEEVVRGVASVVGANTPIVGGSAADNDIAGGWRVFDKTAVRDDAVVVSVLFPSRPLSHAYQNGYAPGGPSGIVTRAKGRTVFEIDGRPAADVYNAWTDGAVALPDARPAQILAESTLHPLGRAIASVSDVPFYLLSHPAVVREDGAIELFCAVPQGERVHLMTGSSDGLARRAGRVATLAKESGHLTDPEIAGALVVYCGGCMLAVDEKMDTVASDVHAALGGAPSLGIFTFGEQGAVVGAENHHGNLMISCVTFAR